MDVRQLDCVTITVASAGIFFGINCNRILREEPHDTPGRFDLNDYFVVATTPVVVEVDMDLAAFTKPAGCRASRRSGKLRKD